MQYPNPESSAAARARQQSDREQSTQSDQWTSGGSRSATVREAADVANEAKEQIAAQAAAAKQRAMQQGKEFAERQKGQTAEQVEVFGAAIREAANKLEHEGQGSIACYAEACADELDRAATYLRERNFRQLYHDANRLARRRPDIFLGGMFIGGLALARFLKASADEVDDDADEQSGSPISEVSAGYQGSPLRETDAATGAGGGTGSETSRGAAWQPGEPTSKPPSQGSSGSTAFPQRPL